MSDKWYWILILNLENAYTLNVGSQIQTKVYILICNLPRDLCDDWLHSLMVLGRIFHWLWHHPPGRRRGSARRWPIIDAVVPMLGKLGQAGVAVWAVTSAWPGAVCELLSPFEHGKYHYLCKNYHHHYCYSWQYLVKALTSLSLNSVLHWVRYEQSIALVAEKNMLLVTLLSHRGTDKYFLL